MALPAPRTSSAPRTSPPPGTLAHRVRPRWPAASHQRIPNDRQHPHGPRRAPPTSTPHFGRLQRRTPETSTVRKSRPQRHHLPAPNRGRFREQQSQPRSPPRTHPVPRLLASSHPNLPNRCCPTRQLKDINIALVTSSCHLIRTRVCFCHGRSRGRARAGLRRSEILR